MDEYFNVSNLQALKSILNEVVSESGKEFSGIGIILHDEKYDLPIFPLRLSVPDIEDIDITEALVKISSIDSVFHDGFHLLSSSFEITHTSQYFSPPILDNVSIDRSKNFGGRYIAALFGSSLPGVLFTGIASNGFGIAIFQSGKEIYFKKDKQ